MSEPINISDAETDARMAAIFASASRPPMGDEAFVQTISRRVGRLEQGRKQRMALAGGLALAAGGVTVFLNGPTALGALADNYAGYMQYAHQLGGGASALLLAAALSVAGWAYAERG
jgi:hypothetical protein